MRVNAPRSGARFSAGQWVFINVPRLGLLHWHPFTISSSGGDDELVLHAAAEGRWTGKLRELTKDRPEAKVYIEGPYGAPMIDVHGSKYKCFVLMSTGMGWTFVRAWKRQLVQVWPQGRLPLAHCRGFVKK